MNSADFDKFILRPSSSLVTHILESKNHRSDKRKRKIALILGAGGMRGAFGAGAVAALDTLGLQNAFEMVIGISVGALQGIYFVGNQGSLLPELFYDNLGDKRFIHLLRKGRVFDMDYFDNVITKTKPFDERAVMNSSIQFYMGVTNALTARGEFIHINKGNVPIINALHASGHIPLLQRKPEPILNKDYIDGFIGCGFPLKFALEKGCTDILLVANAPLGATESLFFYPLIFNALPYSRELKLALKLRGKHYNQLLEDLKHFPQDKTIGIISPENINLSILSTNRSKLKELADNAYTKTIKLFS